MSLITPDFGLLVWMTLIFGIVFFILAKFGFPAITGMVNERAAHIRQSLEDAKKAKEELEGLQETCRKMLDDTRKEQAAMLEQSKKASQQMVEDAKARAASEASQLIALARNQIEVEKREALNDVRNVVVDLAIAVSEKVLREKLQKDENQTVFVDKILAEVEQSRKNSQI